MPHMVDKDLIEEMQERWQKEWEATSTHRFRSAEDMQFSFSFYYYLMNRQKVLPLEIETIWKRDLDVDGNGRLDDNEMITLAALASGRDPTYEYLMQLKTCLLGEEEAYKPSTTHPDDPMDGGPLFTSPTTHVTLDKLKSCQMAMDDLKKNVKTRGQWLQGPYEEVAFEMIGDDMIRARSQLNSIRSRRTKFVCINDDMRYPSPDVQALLQHFYLSFFPTRSQFELPYHLENRYLYLDEYEKVHVRMLWARRGLMASLVLLVCIIIYDYYNAITQPDSKPAQDGGQGVSESEHSGSQEGGGSRPDTEREGGGDAVGDGTAHEVERRQDSSPSPRGGASEEDHSKQD